MYKVVTNIETDSIDCINRTLDNAFIPLNQDNRDYQRFLDQLNDQGTEIVEGELSESILQEAADRKFNKQLASYKQAVERLSQYVLSQGRQEVKEMIPSLEKEEVLVEVVIQTAVDPLPATVEIWEQQGDEIVKKTVRNPAIIQDEADRAAAQAIVDATPEEVKAAA